MNVDLATPRTWLLMALAGWALALWVLSMFGLGERIQRLQDDPDLVQTLPVLANAAPERLGTLAQYSEFPARPLFSETRRPQPFYLTAEGEDKTNTFEYQLTSVLLAPQLRMAILQPTAGGESIRVKLGTTAEKAPGWRLVELQPRSAEFEGPAGRRSLQLRTFNGVGGEAPTVVRPATAPLSQSRAPQAPQTASPQPAAPVSPQPIRTEAVNAQPRPTGEEAAITPEAQVEAIRKRIEARRAQLREQNAPPPEKK